jgi:hypothetical protein
MENQYYIPGFQEARKNGHKEADYKAMADPSTRKLVAKIRAYKRREIVWCIVSFIKTLLLVGLFILYLKK